MGTVPVRTGMPYQQHWTHSFYTEVYMHGLSFHIYKLFDENYKRAKNSYKVKQGQQKDTRTARSSSLNNALKTIQQSLDKK